MATTNYSWNLPTVGGSEDTWGTQLNSNWTALDTLLGGVTALEFSYLDGLSSNVQTQIVNLQDGKQPIDAELTAIAALSPSNNNFIVGNGTTWVAESGSVALGSLGITASATEINYLSGATSNIQNQINTIVAAGGANNSTITITAGDAMAGGGSFTLNQATNASITLAHADTSSQSSVDNSGATFIQDITLDTYGHVISIGSATLTVPGGIGDGQTWQSVSRISGTTYQNTTGKPIMLAASRSDGGPGFVNFELSVNGSSWVGSSNLNADSDDGDVNFEFIVPINGYYRINGTFSAVLELR